MQEQWAENLNELQPFVGTLLEPDTYGALKEFGRRFVERHYDLLIGRYNDGRIRDVHGDLHCEHICFAPEGVQIFDCIEFSPQLRSCDLTSEIAFLLMDLEVRGAGSFVQPFLTRYVELLQDPDLFVLLPFYECYRALVRGKVEALRSNEANALRYFGYASRKTWEPLKPFIVMVCGLTGSGKSALARGLGGRMDVPVISSDVVRKGMAGKLGRVTVPINQGIYSPTMTERTYATMAGEVEKQIVSGAGAILDATFIHKSHRDKIIRLAKKHKVPLVVIHCFASAETVRRRLAQRGEEGKDVSDGRWEIYVRQQADHEPLSELPDADRLELNTEPSLEQLLRVSERFLRSRIEQERI